MTSRSRKIFLGRITVPGDSATSLNALMGSSALKWGFEIDGTTPSLDSIIGSNAGIIPDSPIWIGSDANVKNASIGSFYQGVRVAAGQNFSLQDFGSDFGIIDPNQIYIYSVSGTGCDLAFTAR